MTKYIRLESYEPCCITAKEYKQLEKEVMDRYRMRECGIDTETLVGDRILARLLIEHAPRYHEIKDD
jgi:hypothetical protein